MTKRLQQVESLNKALKSELKEKSTQNIKLQDEIDSLTLLTSADSVKELESLKKERDKYKKQCEEMKKFLGDYGLKWIGNDAAQNDGKFDAKSVND